MSLYYVQKFLFRLNRDRTLRAAYGAARISGDRSVFDGYELTDEEIGAVLDPDIGLLYHLGVNGQILMHFAALHHIDWTDYLQMMRDGLDRYGPVREGVYAMVGYQGIEAHNAELGLRPAPSPPTDEAARSEH